MNPHSCYNRAPLESTITVQDGWKQNGEIRNMVKIPAPMSKDCRYSIHTKDERCTGCVHNQQEKPDG